MPIVLPATLSTAAACAVISLWLALRITRWRVGQRVLHGDGGDALRGAQMRAHANFAEYAPFALALIAGIELARGATPALWALAAVFVVGRILHPFGMDRMGPHPLRAAGIVSTWIVLALLAGWAVAIAYGLDAPRHPTVVEALPPGA